MFIMWFHSFHFCRVILSIHSFFFSKLDDWSHFLTSSKFLVDRRGHLELQNSGDLRQNLIFFTLAIDDEIWVIILLTFAYGWKELDQSLWKIILHHEYTRFYIAAVTSETFKEMNYRSLEHLPHNPDLSTRQRKWNDELGGRRFSDIDGLKSHSFITVSAEFWSSPTSMSLCKYRLNLK